MRGYFTYLLVFLAVFSFIHLVLATSGLNTYNQAKSIAIKKLYQKEMNFKEVVRELARQAVRDAFLLYVAERIATNTESTFNIAELKHRIKNAVYLKFLLSAKLFQSSYEEDDLSFWCSINNIDSESLATSKKGSLDLKSATPCLGCLHIQNIECIELIGVDITLLNTSSLEKSRISVDLSHFGVSLYSKDYNIASVGFIPADGKVEIG